MAVEGFDLHAWVGIGVGVVIFFVILAVITAYKKRAAKSTRRTIPTIPTNATSTNHAPQHPQRAQVPLPNNTWSSTPHQGPLQVPHYQARPTQPQYYQVHAMQPLPQHAHYHHHHPHTALFPSHPLQTYFPLSPAHPPPPQGHDHALRQGASDTISLDELYSFNATGEEGQAPCPICLDPLEDEPVSTGNCLHLAHTSCLKSWLVKDKLFACPVCRVPIAEPQQADALVPVAAPG